MICKDLDQRILTVGGRIVVFILTRMDLTNLGYSFAVKQSSQNFAKLETSRSVKLPPTVSVLCLDYKSGTKSNCLL